MKNTSRLHRALGRFLGRLLSVSLTVWTLGVIYSPAWAAVAVDQQPLIIQKSLPPNIVLMLDDSGSMAWDVMPDWGYLSSTAADALTSSTVNGLYYNPAVDYQAPYAADGSQYPNATFASAWINGFKQSAGSVDLSSYDGSNDASQNGASKSSIGYSQNFTATSTSNYAATTGCNPGDTLQISGTYKGQCKVNGRNSYYAPGPQCNSGDTYSSSSKMCVATTTTNTYLFKYTIKNANGTYTRYYVGKSGACAAASLDASVCTESTAAQQNVANWFSYFHTRILMAKSGLMNSFAGLDATFRVGFGSIDGNNDANLPTDQTKKNGINIANVKPFSDQKTAFWKWLAGETANSGTPLRSALDAVGQYYQTAQPWSAMSSDPDYGTGTGKGELACRQSYTILTTDGFWNGAAASTSIGDADSTSKTIAGPNNQSYTFTAAPPYKDGVSGTLADVAMYYWVSDLRSTPNEVPTNTEDPAFWQHMTTFTLGLGFTPTGIKPSGTTVDQIFNWARGGTAIANFSWPATSADSINNIADLAHAAVNGHGGFYSATSPQAFTSGLKDALKRATERVGTGASLAANSTQLKAGTVAYQANYYTAKWKGDLKALAIDTNSGAIATNPSWTAATVLPAYANRTIYTYNPVAISADVAVFTFTSGNVDQLSAAQKSALGSTTADQQSMINYLRGDSSQELRNSGALRSRDTALGDIVNSQPIYVGAPDPNEFVGQSFTGSSTFATYATNKASRTGLILVAANDGMLHAFDARTGVEAYAYLPGAVITSNLKQLSDPNYGGSDIPHQFFDDGELTVADVYFGSPASWHTVAVGTTGRGLAKAVYAIDVTDPTTFKLLWERSASDSGTNSGFIGQMTGKPVIVQTAAGAWSVLMGNGYNSANGSAALLQFAVADGTLSVHATTDTGTGNGMAAPTVWIGDNTKGIGTAAYAGDAKGQVWKFVLNDGTDAKPSSTGSLVFTAQDSGGVVQPITAGMLMGRDPATSNLWLFFGTGKYLASTDLGSTATQTWYGLIVQSSDDVLVSNLATKGRSALVERDIIVETAGDSAATPPVSPGRAITAASTLSDLVGKSGWYMDLTSPLNGAEGERMVTPSQFQGSLLVGTTRIPQATDVCNPSGRGWIMAINPFTGNAPSSSFFDLNGNGSINDSDALTSGGKTYVNSGIGFSSLPNNPIFVGGVMLVSFDNGANGAVNTAGSDGISVRVSWREMGNL